jgi:uncharacterized protein
MCVTMLAMMMWDDFLTRFRSATGCTSGGQGVQGVVRSWWKLGGRVDPTFLVLFERAGGFAVDAADALVELFEADEISETTFARLDEIEHKADSNTHDLLSRLEKGHMPPLPATTTRQLAIEIDAIVDAAEGAAELALLTGVRRATPIAHDMAVVLAKTAREVASLTAYLGGGTGYRPYVARVHDYEHEGDDLWMEAHRSLFSGEIDAIDIIRWKDIYGQLEEAIDRCETTAKLIGRALGGD